MKTNKHYAKIILAFDIIVALICITTDRLLKYYAITKLKAHPNKSLITGILELRYSETTAAAFGLLDNQKSFFILVSVIVLLAIMFAVTKMPKKKHFGGANFVLALLFGGIIGNLTDRIMYSCVIDMIYFNQFGIPLFNLADLYISISILLLIILVLFFYKEDDFNFLKFKEKRLREVN